MSETRSPTALEALDSENESEKKPAKNRLGVRHIQALLLFFCLVANYMMRVNLSIALVIMTDNSTGLSQETFNWSNKERSILLSSFFWGYLVMNFIAAVLVTKLNNKVLLLLSVLFSSAVTLLTPFIVHFGGFLAFVAARIFLGLMQGFMMPVTSAQLSRWVPQNERGRCGSLVLGGMYIGTILSFISSGILGVTKGGWPNIFYCSGGIAFLWCFAWYFWGSERPSTCNYLSEEEKDYIETFVIASIAKKKSIPWKRILTNLPCISVAVAALAHSWGFWTLVTEMPTYFSSVLHMNTTNNGLITALPYFCLWIVSFPSSYVSDTLIKKGVTSITFSRKFFNTMGQWGAASCLLALGFATKELSAIIVYTVGVTVSGFTFVGFNINLLDICPNFAGMIMGLANGIANLGSLLGPLFVGYIVEDVGNAESWRTVFCVSAGIFFMGNVFFICFGSGKVQEFDRDADECELECVRGTSNNVRSQ